MWLLVLINLGGQAVNCCAARAPGLVGFCFLMVCTVQQQQQQQPPPHQSGAGCQAKCLRCIMRFVCTRLQDVEPDANKLHRVLLVTSTGVALGGKLGMEAGLVLSDGWC